MTSSTLQSHLRRWTFDLSKRLGRTWGAAASTTAEIKTPGFHRAPMVPFPQSPRRTVPESIQRPPYAKTGQVPPLQHPDSFYIHDEVSASRMRQAARLARRTLDVACAVAQPGVTTDHVDAVVHDTLIQAGAYPSPLNYAGFPKSVCSSVNEVICHGIPDMRPLELGDVVSFDVSCFLNGVHGDNCATIIVGDQGDPDDKTNTETDWRGIAVRTEFDNPAQEAHFVQARKLVNTTREALYAAIATVRPGSCLTEVGNAIDTVAEQNGYQSVRKYRGHGISHEFHVPPFVKHYRNNDRLELHEGMIFTIEPMLVMGAQECWEWDDEWTVVTSDGSLSAQFEHTILITSNGTEILTLPE